jgi:hypothetical protein
VLSLPLNRQGNNFVISTDIPSNVKSLRFDPVEGKPCIINDVRIVTDRGAINYTDTNGIEINGVIIFDTIDPQIKVDFKAFPVSKLKISGIIYEFSFDDIAFLSKTRNAANKLKMSIETIRDITSSRDAYKTLYENISSSTFWRLTKPARSVVTGVKFVLKKLPLIKHIYKFFWHIRHRGIAVAIVQVKRYLFRNHSAAYRKNITLSNYERRAQKNKIFPQKITISIITPLYNTPENFLREMIHSVQEQTYGYWELCLANGSDKEHEYVMRICEGYAQKDKRIKYKKLEGNFGISGNSNAAIEMSTGGYIGLLDHDDILHPAALYQIMRAICYENADFIIRTRRPFQTK